MSSAESEGFRIAILGASGYTGAELLRLLSDHKGISIRALTADRHAGSPVGRVHPQLWHLDLPDLMRIEDVEWNRIDGVFCCLPHGMTQETVAALPDHLKVVDLSADFRLADTAVYRATYGKEHQAPDLQTRAVYGLTEVRRDEIRRSNLVANPGCYTSTAEFPLIPCLEQSLIEVDSIVIDAKSGVSGAGRAAKENLLHTEVAEGFAAYGIGTHRHAPEIDQELSRAAGEPVVCTFTPHLVPMNRGILATIYVHMKSGVQITDLSAAIAERYRSEPFVRLVPSGMAPSTHHVRGTNMCLIGVFPDRTPQRAILVSVLDNLLKGASGQALQNLNLMAGFDETTALPRVALAP